MSAEHPDLAILDESTELLTRSRTEIGLALDGLCRRRVPLGLTLRYDEGELFTTRLRHVDANAGRFVIEYSDSKMANSRLLAARRVALHANVGSAHLVWVAFSPANVMHEKRDAVRLDFPELLIRHRQRSHPRFRIPPQLKVKCKVECPGYIPFEMEITDISLNGQGMMLSNPQIELAAGTILRGCRILYPGRRPVVVDLEVRYAHATALADNDRRRRVGCQFIGKVDDVAALIRLFSVELDIVS